MAKYFVTYSGNGRHGSIGVKAATAEAAVAYFRTSLAFQRLNYPRIVRVGRIGEVPRPWVDAPLAVEGATQ